MARQLSGQAPVSEPTTPAPPPGSTLGVIMQMGGSLRDYERNGQIDNLFRYHLSAYLQVFERISFFSYQDERIEDYTDDPVLRARITVWPKRSAIPDKLYALLLPFVHRGPVRDCAVFRVLQATGALPTIIARAAFGVPYVSTFGYRYAEFASIERSRLKGFVVSLFERMAIRWAAAVIVTTDAMRRYVAGLGGSRRTVMIPNGVDTTLFNAMGPRWHGAGSSESKVLFVGRLERQKNLGVLIEALGIVCRRHPIRLTLVGDGSLRDDLAQRAAAAGVPVDFVGFVPNDQLPMYYRAADVFVLPSLAEGHPKALLEAMSCGAACVVSSCEGNRSVITPGETALIHDPSDVEALAQAVERVLTDRSLRANLSRRARELATAQFDISRALEATNALLCDVAAGQARVRLAAPRAGSPP